MNNRQQLDARAMALMVVLCLIWGIQQVVIKATVADISPLTQAALRSIGATLLVAGWCWKRGERLLLADGTLLPGMLAAFLFSVEFALIYASLRYTSASRGVLLLYTAPFFIALSAPWVLPGERLRAGQWLGLLAAFGGVALLTLDRGGAVGPDHWLGDGMMVLAALFWAATTLTIKTTRLVHISSNRVLFYQLAGSALLFPPLAWLLGEPGIVRLSSGALMGLAYQTVVIATFSYIAWFWLIKHYPPTRLSVFSFLAPLFGVIAGHVFLAEPLTPAILGAVALIGSGIALVNRPARP